MAGILIFTQTSDIDKYALNLYFVFVSRVDKDMQET